LKYFPVVDLAHCVVYRGLADDPHHVLLLVERFLLVLITVGTDFLPYGFRSRLPRHWANGREAAMRPKQGLHVPLLKGGDDARMVALNFPFWIWHRYSFSHFAFPVPVYWAE
jgi:hypothetical protein